jgi:hypothetical protein
LLFGRVLGLSLGAFVGHSLVLGPVR